MLGMESSAHHLLDTLRVAPGAPRIVLTFKRAEMVGRSLAASAAVNIYRLGDMVANGAWTLGEFPLPMVRLSCAKCGRRGQYRTVKLLEQYGADMSMPELRHVLAECPRREQWHDPCMVVFDDKLS